jgi:tyrosyl-tRNA synthetase
MTMGDGVSFAEFSYPIMQGWDWWHMFTSMNIKMQIGGSDQYGNILSGIETVKAARASEPDPVKQLPQESSLDDPVGFTVPLLTDSSGQKFGKSAGNAIWLDQFETPVYDFYGYFVRRSDDEVEKLLNLLTFLPQETIKKTMQEHNADPAKRIAQHLLAFEVMTLVHGLNMAQQTQAMHRAMHSKGHDASDPPPSLETVAQEGDIVTANNAPPPDVQLPESLIKQGSIARILFAAGLAKSASEGHRLCVQQGAYIGASPGQKPNKNAGMLFGQLQFMPVKLMAPEDIKNFIIDDKLIILRKGKHNVRIVEIVSDEEYEKSGKTYPGQPYTGKVRMLNDKLKQLKAGLVEAEAIEDALKDIQESDVDQDEPTIVYPQEKGRQEKALEKKLTEFLENEVKGGHS